MIDVDAVKKLYEQGYSAVTVVTDDGAKQKLRLFESGRGLCYYGVGKRRWGYLLNDFLGNVVAIKPATKKKVNGYERYISDLHKFKKLFSTAVLWDDYKDGYAKLDISDFENFVSSKKIDKNNTYQLWELLREYSRAKNISVVNENNYKLTTIKSNKSIWGSGDDYYTCIKEIESKIANREPFQYSWRSRYDVSVSANVGADGIYRGWLSLEYKNCGNGHYYFLIDSNRAVFGEDD